MVDANGSEADKKLCQQIVSSFFNGNDRYFAEAKQLFERISNRITCSNSWLDKTPSEIRREIQSANSIEEWLQNQF